MNEELEKIKREYRAAYRAFIKSGDGDVRGTVAAMRNMRTLAIKYACESSLDYFQVIIDLGNVENAEAEIISAENRGKMGIS